MYTFLPKTTIVSISIDIFYRNSIYDENETSFIDSTEMWVGEFNINANNSDVGINIVGR